MKSLRTESHEHELIPLDARAETEPFHLELPDVQKRVQSIRITDEQRMTQQVKAK